MPNVISSICHEPKDLLQSIAHRLNDNAERKVRIGLIVNATHYEDTVWFCKSVLNKIIPGNTKVQLVVFGWNGFNGSYTNPFADIGKDNIEFVPGVPVGEYFNKLAALKLDIGIIPLRETEFNKYKSSQRYAEFAMLKIPVIIGSSSAYGEGLSEIRCNSPDDFIMAIGSLVDDHEERQTTSMILQSGVLSTLEHSPEILNNITETVFPKT